MKSFRNIRVIPVVLVAVAGLATLKVVGLVINGGYVFDYQPSQIKKSWAQENLNFPTGREDSDITGSTHGAPKEAPKPAAPETKPEGTVVKMDEAQPQVSASERAIGGLKLAVRDVNENLGSQLAAATQMSDQLYKQLGEADNVVRRLSKIAIAARPAASPEAAAVPAAKPSSAKAVAAAAEAFSERRRSNGLAV